MYVRLRNGKFEVNKTLSRGQWGLSQDDAGRIYRNTNSSALYVDLVPTPYFTRNPTMLRTRGSYEFLGQDGERHQHHLADSPDPRRQPRLPGRCPSRGRHAGVVHRGGGADHLSRRSPARGTVRQRVRRRAVGQPRQPDHHRRRREGAAGAEGLRARRVHRVDRRAVPAGLPLLRARRHACTSSICIAGSFSTRATSRSICAIRFCRGSSSSRPGSAACIESCTRPRSATARPRFRKRPRQRLVETLSHPNGWWRDTAQRLLVERNDKSAMPALRKLAIGAKDFRTQAARVVDPRRHGEHRPGDRHSGAGRPPSRRARGGGPGVGEMAEGAGACAARAGGPADERQRLGGQGAGGGIARRAAGWRAGGGARVGSGSARHRSDCRGRRAQRHEGRRRSGAGSSCSSAPAETPARSAAVTLVAGTIVAAAQDRPGAGACSTRSRTRSVAAWQRSALLRGAEVSLLGAAAPGSPAGRGRGRGAAQAAQR